MTYREKLDEFKELTERQKFVRNRRQVNHAFAALEKAYEEEGKEVSETLVDAPETPSEPVKAEPKAEKSPKPKRVPKPSKKPSKPKS